MSTTLRRHGLLLGLLALLALLLTWPLVSKITTHVPGSNTWAYDEYTFIWSMWWFKYSLLDLRESILFSQQIFYPLGMELILYSYNLMAAIMALPLGLASNWAFTANIGLLFNIVLSGYGAYLLALWTLRAWVGGWRSEVGGRRSEVGDRRSEVGGQQSEVGGQRLESRQGLPRNTQHATRTTQHATRNTQHIHLAAFIAALVFAFASNRAIYLALGHYNIHSVLYLPFFLLYLLRLLDRPTRHNVIMAGLFGAFNLLVDMQYGVFMAFFAACLLLTKPLRGLLFRRPLETRRWLALLTTGALAMLFTLPYFWATVRSFLTADFLLAGWGDALKLSADLVGWLTPTALHPLWGSDWVQRLREVQQGVAPFRDVNTVFLGYVTLLLALAGSIIAWRLSRGSDKKVEIGRSGRARQQPSRGWILAAVVSGLFTLGPLLQIYGETVYDFDGLESSVPMPFLLLHYIPLIKGNRTANRWSIVVMLALAVLAAWGAWWLLQRLRGSSSGQVSAAIAIVLAGFILFEHIAVPLPLTDARIPEAVQALAKQADGAVLQIPMGWRNSFGVLGSERTQAQYYMTAHEQPILSGNTSRNPPIKFDYFERLPLVAAITGQEFGNTPDAETLAAAEAQAGDLVTLWGVRYLMTLPPVPGHLPYADHWQASQQLALDLIPHSEEPIIDDGQIQVWAVEPDEPLPLALDFGGQVTDAWRGRGWARDEADVGGASGIWATAERSHVLFRSEDTTPRRLKLRVQPFTWPGATPQKLTIALNDKQLDATITLAPGWQEYEVELTPQVGINHLWFEFGRVDSPRLVLAQAMVGTTAVQSPANIDIHGFDQAFITLSDADGVSTDASFGRRGFNVTILDPGSGDIVAKEGFDTVANAFEVERLVEYLQQIPEGSIVLIATREGAGDFVSPSLIDALAQVGSGVTDPARLRGQAFALAGIAGAAPGTASEIIDPADAFLRISGDFRTLAAALDWLAIE
ncbi:MAG: hypothetical protein GY759_07455 [Chloroflexi bacterium]|nr:hypothetical protein [Chloroflexota bacterium]